LRAVLPKAVLLHGPSITHATSATTAFKARQQTC
jgi:hypothetical protein